MEQNISALNNENIKLKSDINNYKNTDNDKVINEKMLKELKEENEKLNKKINEFHDINNRINEKGKKPYNNVVKILNKGLIKKKNLKNR